MVAILLCAGFGTRLYPLTKNRPNALLDIAGKPVLDYQMEQLVDLPELSEIHVVINSRFAAPFYSWWMGWRSRCEAKGITLRLHNDGSIDHQRRLGEVGDLNFVVRRLAADGGVVVSAGDNIYRFPLEPIWDRFREEKKNLVLAFPENHRQVLQQHTVVEFDAGKRLTRVHDQPQDPPAQWVAPSLYFLRPDALSLAADYLESSGEADRLAQYLSYLIEYQPVQVVEMPSGDLRLHVNTRYMYEKAREVMGRVG